MKPRPIIFDTDPGIDDAAAITIAIRNPQLDVKLLSTVGANVEVEKTTLNALKLTEFLEVDVPVAKGCSAPLLKELEPCPEVHGKTGMDGFAFPPVTKAPLEKHAVEAMREIIMASEEKVTLVVIGTHTNIAILFRLYPEVKERIAEIVTMGGGLCGGNTNSSAEFNIYNDPHAAAIVFGSGVPITMLGLHVTRKALLHRAAAERIDQADPAGHMLYSLFVHYRGGSLASGLMIHDACAVAYLLRPALFQTEMMSIEIATEGIAAGTTVSDYRAVKNGEKTANVNVCIDVDAAGFETWFLEEFCKTAGERS